MLKLMWITRLSWSTDWLGASASNIYRPQRSCGKVIFSEGSVSHSVHRGWTGVSALVHAGIHPLGRHPLPSPWTVTSPRKHTPLGSTPHKHTPPKHTPGITLPRSTPPWEAHPPKPLEADPREADSPPPAQCMLGDTGNKRAVSILLECILVCYNFCYC